jgi:hypothetical protein
MIEDKEKEEKGTDGVPGTSGGTGTVSVLSPQSSVLSSKKVRDQEKLSFGRSIEFCISSIRHRFFRSAVTLSVIVLAVAFLMNILTETMISSSVARGVQNEFERLYVADIFEQRLARNTPLSSLVTELSRLRPDAPRWKELERWSGLGHAGFAQLVASARAQITFDAFFDNLDFGRRRSLVKRNEGNDIYDYLASEDNQKTFAVDMKTKEMASVSVPGDLQALFTFVNGWHAYRDQLAGLQKGILAALDRIDTKLDKPVNTALDGLAAEKDAAQVERRRAELLAVLTEAGFEVSAPELVNVTQDRYKLVALGRFNEYVQDSEFHSHWADLKIPGDFTPEVLLKEYLKEERVRKWVRDRANVMATRTTTPLPVSREMLLKFSDDYRQRVQNAGRSIAHLSDGEVFKSERQKKFINYIDKPVFAQTWESLKLNEPFGNEALLWHFSENRAIWHWLLDTANTQADPLPCTEDDVKSLAEAYLRWVQKRGLQKVPLETAAENDAKLTALIEYLKDPEYKAHWDELGISTDYSPAAIMLFCTADERGPQVVAYVENNSHRIAGRVKAPLPLTEDEVLELARMEEARNRVRDMQAQLTSRGTTTEGISERTFWLIAVSFLVCVVGIANAMLMAVTERFREIATMKCLGALDEFIMTIFLIESGLQGFIGAVFGVALGLILAVLRCAGSYGFYTSHYFPVLDVLRNSGISTGAGMLLAMLAAVYPAWVASRMAPMEAMRVE